MTEPARPRVIAPSLVLVNTGHCKGKSTAAFGVMLRALARGWRVAVVQFMAGRGLRLTPPSDLLVDG